MGARRNGVEQTHVNDINYILKYTIDSSAFHIFKLNNWIDEYNSRQKNNISTLDILNKLYKKNCAIWFNAHGDLCYRLSLDGDTIVSSWKKIGYVFHNLFGLDIEVKKYGYGKPVAKPIDHKKLDKLKYTIYINELIMVEKEIFYPKIKREFCKKDRLFHKNIFKPTRFMTQNEVCHYESKYSIILQYIYHLSNYNRERFNYIINWLANMFNNLTKSCVALILIGKKESGRDILFNDIIKPLFGFQYCIEIDDNDLEVKHFDKLFKDKIFYNFNEISHEAIDKKTKNICKEVIESNVVFIEKNYKESYQETKIFAQTLITTSKPYTPIIDTSRLNYTIFNIKQNLEEMPIQDGIKVKRLHQYIKDDLNNFVLFLKSFKVDISLANQPFDKDDKNIMLDCNKDIYEIFIEAIKTEDKEYFKKVKDDTALYKGLLYDFDRDRVNQANLAKYFSIIYPEEPIMHTKTLLKKLRELDDKFFNHNNIKSSNGKQFFIIL